MVLSLAQGQAGLLWKMPSVCPGITRPLRFPGETAGKIQPRWILALWPPRAAAKSLDRCIFPTAHPDSAPPTDPGTSLRICSHSCYCSGLPTSPRPMPGTLQEPHPGASEERQDKLRWGVGGGRHRPPNPTLTPIFLVPPHGAFLVLRFPFGRVITAVIRKTIILAEWEYLNLFLPPWQVSPHARPRVPAGASQGPALPWARPPGN